MDVLLIQREHNYHGKFGNTPKGFNSLQKWLKKQQVSDLHVCMEATGSYGEAIANFLFEAGFKVSVVNPSRIYSFARSEMIRTKTDPVDAGIIARFCRALNPAPWKPLPSHIRELRNLVRRREALKEMYRREANRMKNPGLSDYVQASMSRIILVLKNELKQIEQLINQQINCHEELKEKMALLVSIPGIAEQPPRC